jgi:hypothetical protein
LKTRAESNEKRAHAAELYSEKLKKENDALHTAAAGSATIPSDAAVPAVPTAAAPPPPPPPLGPPPPPLPTFKPIRLKLFMCLFIQPCLFYLFVTSLLNYIDFPLSLVRLLRRLRRNPRRKKRH